MKLKDTYNSIAGEQTSTEEEIHIQKSLINKQNVYRKEIVKRNEGDQESE